MLGTVTDRRAYSRMLLLDGVTNVLFKSGRLLRKRRAIAEVTGSGAQRIWYLQTNIPGTHLFLLALISDQNLSPLITFNTVL